MPRSWLEIDEAWKCRIAPSPPPPISLVLTLFYSKKIHGFVTLFSYFYPIQRGLKKLQFTQILIVRLSL